MHPPDWPLSARVHRAVRGLYQTHPQLVQGRLGQPDQVRPPRMPREAATSRPAASRLLTERWLRRSCRLQMRPRSGRSDERRRPQQSWQMHARRSTG